MDLYRDVGISDHPIPLEVWTLAVELDAYGYYAGTVSRYGDELVRITLTSDLLSRREAVDSLAEKSRMWVRHYLDCNPQLH